MAGFSDLIGQLVHSAQYAPQPSTDQMLAGNGQQEAPAGVGLPSLEQSPQNLTGVAAARPFTHEQVVRKHGLSNILSILGDAFLASHGLEPQYLPRLNAAREADATEGYDNDPLEAIKRLTLVNPGDASKLRNDLYTNMYHQQLSRTSAAAEQKDLAAVPGIAAESQDKVLLPLAGLVGKANKDTYGGIRAYVDKTLRANGLGARADLLPSTFTPEGITGWAQSALDPAKQAQIDYRNRRGNQFDEQLGLNRENVDSEVGYRGTMAGVAQQNAGTNARRASDQSRNIDDTISYRAWQKQDGDRKTASVADWRKWQEAHPTKSRVGASLPPPRKVGDTIHGSDGSNFTSKDGKTWSPL